MRRISLSFVLLAALTAPAIAGGWSPFENAFPAYPCQDGWAGCVVDGAGVGPGALKDAAGRPLPSDARFGWFDLKPTVHVSPFASLSVYSGPVGGAVAQVEEPAAPPPVERPPEDAGTGGGSGSSDVRTDTVAQVEPTQVATSTPTPSTTSTGGMRPGSPSSTTTTTTTTSPTTTTTAATTTPTGGMRPGSPSSTTTTTTTATAPATTTGGMRPGSPSTAPTTTTTQQVSTAPTTSTTTTTGGSAPVQAVAMAPQDDSCTDLVKLEPAAMMGQLRPGQGKCLDTRIGTESAQTMKDKVSRLMITNAEAKGDKTEWERLMKRHLEDIDRSDPDLCFKYALHLSRGGVGRAQGVIRWADYSLENKSKWSGTTYKTRVNNLYKLRAEAANKLWQDAEKTYMETDHSDENEAKAAKYRGQAKDYSREWLDYAKASEQDTKTAMALCVSSSGNRAFCEGG
jgi:hypothetical protein